MVSHRAILHLSRRALLWGGGLLAVTLLLLWLALQIIILNDVGRYRPDVVAALSKATGTRVEIGSMTSARFEWLPTVVLDHVTIFDPEGQPGLVLNHVEGRISILGFLRGRVDLSTLIIDQPSLTLRRAADGQLFLSGIPLPRPDSGPSQFMEWLVNQGEIRVTKGTIRWVDDALKVPPLLLTQGNIRIRNSGSHHRVDMAFSPPSRISDPVTIKGDFYGEDMTDFRDWHGSVIAQSTRMDLGSLKPWIPQLSRLESGHGPLKLTLSMASPQQWGLQADGDISDLEARLEPGLSVLHFDRLRGGMSFKALAGGFDIATDQLVVSGAASLKTIVPLDMHLLYTETGGSLQVNQLELAQLTGLADALPLSAEQRARWHEAGFKGRVSHLDLTWKGSQAQPTEYAVHSDFTDFQANPRGLLPAIRGFSGHLDASADGGQLKGKGTDTVLNFPKIFAVPIPVRTYNLDASWTHQQAQTEIRFNRFEVENADLAGYLTGKLSVGPEGPGDSQFSGELQRASPAAVWRYMPLDVSADARNWLQGALTGGTARHVAFEVSGNLQKFPFPHDQGGKFRVSAQIADAVLRYDADWPVITGIQANLLIQGEALSVTATDGLIMGTKIKAAHAQIPDLTQADPLLAVTGEAEGSVHDGLNFIARSPVSKYINHFTDALQGEGAGRLNLELQIPLNHAKDTKIKGDYQFLDASMDDGDAGIPPITQIQGHLSFTEKLLGSQGLTASVMGGPAVFELSTLPSGVTRLVAHGNADMSHLIQVYHQQVLADVSGKAEWKGEFNFSEKLTDIRLESQAAYLGEPVTIRISTLKDGTLDVALKGKTSQASLMRRYPVTLLKALDSPVDWNGHVFVRSGGRDEVSINGAALVFHEPAKILVSGSSRGKLLADLSGRLALGSLRRLGYNGLADHATGATDWHARIEQEGARMRTTVTSSLSGVAIDFPEPFHKEARTQLPLSVIWTAEGSTRQLNAALDNWLGMRVAYVASAKGDSLQARRGVINLGGEAPTLPPDGFSVIGTLRHADLDQWQKMWGDPSGNALDGGFFGPLTWVNVGLEDFRWGGRIWGGHRVTATQEGGHWQIQTRGAEAEGEITWLPEGAGRIRAHFTKLVVPTAPPGADAGETPVNVDAQKNMPSMDLVADRFGAKGKALGRLQVSGVRDGGVWRLDRFSLVSAQGAVDGDGRWTGAPTPQTQVNLHLKATDLGKMLSDFGYPNMVARGEGEVRGQMNWSGNPQDFKLVRAAGQFSLDLHDGQFSKVEPGGAGRLIGLLSLQTLPRRITLDFHDIFSDGFAFDTLTANIAMNRGVFSTRDFDMTGPAARVMLSGTVDVATETTELNARVSPALGSSVSLATTVIGGPIAGAASYLLQKLLKNPIDKALTYEYAIEGGWDDPKIKPMGPSAVSATPRQ
jgi:uncharacterized protein YhdP